MHMEQITGLLTHLKNSDGIAKSPNQTSKGMPIPVSFMQQKTYKGKLSNCTKWTYNYFTTVICDGIFI